MKNKILLFVLFTSLFTTQSTQAFFDRPLFLGTSGEDVSLLQRILQQQGHYQYPYITGVFGSITEAALKSFQKANNIVTGGTPETTGYGRLGPVTRDILNQQIQSNPATSNITNTSASLLSAVIYRIQQLLNIPATGVMDTTTITAISNYQANIETSKENTPTPRRSGGSSGGGSNSGGGGGFPNPNDTTSPAISNISVSTTETTAAITWETNELSNSKIFYGADVSYGNASSSSSMKSFHSIALTGLTGGITYHYQIESSDSSGNTATSSDQTFFTISPNLNIRTEGDSLMDGAYGFRTREALATLVSPKELEDTAVGGSTMNDIRDRVLLENSEDLLPYTTVFWDGSQNGMTTVEEYADLLEEAINALGHNRFVVIPAIVPMGNTYAGSQAEAIANEFESRWPDNFLHWCDSLANTNCSISNSEFATTSDVWHLGQSGVNHMAIGIWNFLLDKGWVEGDATDPILSEGSIWLFDPSIGSGSFDGIPSNGERLPNIAMQYADDLVSGDTLDTYVSIYDTNATSSDVFIERTNKQGLHVVLDQGEAYIGGDRQGVLVQPNAAIQQYLDDNVDDNWYFSIWYRPTRAPLAVGANATNTAPQSIYHKAQNTTNYLFNDQGAVHSISPASGSNRLGSLSVGEGDYQQNLNSPIFRSIGTTGYTGNQPTMGFGGTGLGHGGFGLSVVLGSGDAWGYFNNGAAPSGILYRVYAENLSISGRTFTEVSTKDKLLFEAAFAEEGGAFSNDTYSDPDVVMPVD